MFMFYLYTDRCYLYLCYRDTIVNAVDILGFQDMMTFLQSVLNVKVPTGIKRGGTMLTIDYKLITVMEACYLLSNYDDKEMK